MRYYKGFEIMLFLVDPVNYHVKSREKMCLIKSQSNFFQDLLTTKIVKIRLKIRVPSNRSRRLHKISCLRSSYSYDIIRKKL